MSRILRSHSSKMLTPLYDVIIDFNESSEAWNANKKKTPSGYKYTCECPNCNRVVYKTLFRCYIHRNVETQEKC